MPIAPITQMPPTSADLSAGRRATKLPTSKITAAATMNTTAPALLEMASMMRENEKMITPSPSIAMTGNSIGCSTRRRADSLCAGSSDADSLHA